MPKPTIVLTLKSSDHFEFSLTTDDGKVIGRGHVKRAGGPPDQRTPAEKLKQAKDKIERLKADFASASIKTI